MTIFIAFDVLYYSLRFAAYSAEMERLNEDIEMWTHQLAICDSKDDEQQKMILEKLASLRSELKKI